VTNHLSYDMAHSLFGDVYVPSFPFPFPGDSMWVWTFALCSSVSVSLMCLPSSANLSRWLHSYILFPSDRLILVCLVIDLWLITLQLLVSDNTSEWHCQTNAIWKSECLSV
jgi:hypothetical protein